MTEAQKARKAELNRGYHKERMKNDLDYRMRKLLATINARCKSGKGRSDWQYYGGLPVTLTVNDLKTLWVRDNANKMTRPTIDRKKGPLGYTFENCQFIEHGDNLRKMIPTRRKRRWKVKPVDADESHPRPPAALEA